MTHQTTVLIILDGWGYRSSSEGNAIHVASTPVMDKLLTTNPHTLIRGDGLAVGLPDGQMGNSEVGHMSLGAGRLVHQDFTRITKAIEDGSFSNNTALIQCLDQLIKSGAALHIAGLLSDGGVHSHEMHTHALIQLAASRGVKQIYVHAFLDGRDTAPKSAEASLQKLDQLLSELNCGRIVSLVGRYYAMDRDNNFDRTLVAYDLLTSGSKLTAKTAIEGLHQAYAQGKSDEFVQATTITGRASDDVSAVVLQQNDLLVLTNFRADRSRQLSRAFSDPDFSGFIRKVRPKLTSFVTFTSYASDISSTVLFPKCELKNTLGEHLSTLGKKQLRLAETEKYAHVTFFFNGGHEAPWKGESRILVKSPAVATYDLMPEMSANAVTDHLTQAIDSENYDLIVCNYANPDMVGHTGNFEATITAIECIDRCIGRVIQSLQVGDNHCLITADHGNAEQMFGNKGQMHTAHTSGPVPLIYIGSSDLSFYSGGVLSNVAPTVLELMNIGLPDEMSEKSLIVQN